MVDDDGEYDKQQQRIIAERALQAEFRMEWAYQRHSERAGESTLYVGRRTLLWHDVVIRV